MSDRRQGRDHRDSRQDRYDERYWSQSSGGGYPPSIIDAYRSSSGSETRTVSPSARNRDSGSTMSSTTWIRSSADTRISRGRDDRDGSPRGRPSGTSSTTYIRDSVQTSPARPNVRPSPTGGSPGRSTEVRGSTSSRSASIREASRGPSPGSGRGSPARSRPSSTESGRERRRRFEATFSPSERQQLNVRGNISSEERDAIRFVARMSPEERRQINRWGNVSGEGRDVYRRNRRDS